MALHTYLCEGVNSAVVECGIGGEYDSTNILLRPTVTGITSLGIDHTAMLGNTIGQIAWHKAGIMKSGVTTFTVPQPEEAMVVLQHRAVEKDVELVVVERHPQLESIKLGLAADFQKTNASLAIAVAAAHLRALGHKDISTKPLSPEFVRGLEQVRLGGRCETRREKELVWYLDGGHTLESIEVAGQWFASCVKELALTTMSTPPRILIFNQQTRDPLPLLRALHDLLASSLESQHPFSHVLFCSNVTFMKSGYGPDLMNMNTTSTDVAELKVQHALATGWKDIVAEATAKGGQETQVSVVRTIEEAIVYARDVARFWTRKHVDNEKPGSGRGVRGRVGEVMVLVTGSVHLVGGVLEVLETAGE